MSNIESNKMIAEFMGYKYFPFDETKKFENPNIIVDQMNGWHKPTNGHYKVQDWYLCRTAKDMAYHYKWDWLMPVCGKICKTTPYNSYLAIETISVFADIKDVYKAVVEFIEWHNLNSKTPPSIIKDNG